MTSNPERAKNVAIVGTIHQMNLLESVLIQNGETLADIDLFITISSNKLGVKNELNIPKIINRKIDLFTVKTKVYEVLNKFKKIIPGNYKAYFCNDNNLIVQVIINNRCCTRAEMIEDGLGSYLPRKRKFYGKDNITSYIYHSILKVLFFPLYQYSPRYYFGQYMHADCYWGLNENAFPLVKNKKIINHAIYNSILKRDLGDKLFFFSELVNSSTLVYLESPVVEDKIIESEIYTLFLIDKFNYFVQQKRCARIIIKTHPRSNEDFINTLIYRLKLNVDAEFLIYKEKINLEALLSHIVESGIKMTSLLSSSIYYAHILNDFSDNYIDPEKVTFLNSDNLNNKMINDFQNDIKRLNASIRFI